MACVKDCACTNEDCERRGNCCKCVEFHRSKDSLPACIRHLGK